MEKFEEKPGVSVGSLEIKHDLLEKSTESAKLKLERIMEPDFYDYAVRMMSIEEFKSVINNPDSIESKEVGLINHLYKNSKRKKGVPEIYDEPAGAGMNYSNYLHQDEQRPDRKDPYKDEFGEIWKGTSFVEYLHRDQIQSHKAFDWNEKNKDKERFFPKKENYATEENWRQRVRSHTFWPEGKYDLALVLDVDLVGKANGAPSYRKWGFIHFINKDDQSHSIGSKILGVVAFNQEDAFVDELVKVTSSVGLAACPIFNKKGEIVFPR